MKWINIKDQPLPKDKQFIALWKGAICIAEYDDDDGHFYLCCFPAVYPNVLKVSKDRELKFTHWFYPEKPDDY